MANNFSKEERVAFEDILEGFNDSLVISRNVSKYGTNGQLMERSNDTIWRPVPYIVNSENRTVGSAVSAQDVKQLSVPSSLGYKKVVPWQLDALELRDALQENRLGKAAYQRLASDVNTAVRDVASLQGSLVVAISTAAGDYDDIASVESVMNEQGIMEGDRYMALATRDYNGMAGDLASRSTMTGKPTSAYERSYVGPVAGFETYKMDTGKRITAAAGGGSITIDTTGALVDYEPKAAESTVAGEINVDNRYQQVTVSSTTSVVAGDAFTIAGVEAVHHITKESTGQLKTFRVISVDSGTTMTISPPIVGATGTPTDPQAAYKNAEIASTSATAAITWLNTTTAPANVFWHKDSIEILPGRYAVPDGAGVDVMRGTIDQGLEVVMTKKFDNSTFTTFYTLDVLFGVVNTNPEMNGILLFNQS
jgi:uncharacterized protein YdbL (DUF1318 family)